MNDDYIQPDFYRFNQDSLELVRFVLNHKKHCTNVLDLGAGSGVIGIELSNSLKPLSLTLLEMQSEYMPFLESNVKTQLKVILESRIIQKSFGEWRPDQKFDLIVCNPPYYLPGHGKPSLNPQRDMARSFVKDDWKTLLKLIHNGLINDGEAYLVIKNDPTLLTVIKNNIQQLSLEVTNSGDLSFLKLSRLNEN